MYPFIYKITTFDKDFDTECQKHAGVGFADSFSQAMRRIEEYFGDTVVSVESLELCEEQSIIELPFNEQIIHMIEKENMWVWD